MSTTTGTPDTIAGRTPALNAALAAFQAEIPKIIKDEVGIIPGKDGKQGYKYRYADLAAVSEIAFPALSKHGLAFFAKPVIAGNQFGLVCKLKHASGEEEEGFYPLPSTGTQQAIGSAITYGRRYSMLMMTGLAPSDDDDDGAAASTAQQRFAPASAGEAFANAAPASRPAPAQAPATADPAVVADWGAKIDAIATPEDAGKADAELKDIFKNGRMGATTANAIRGAIKRKATSLDREAARPAELHGHSTGQPPDVDAQTAAFARRAVAAKDLDELAAVWSGIRTARKASGSFVHEGAVTTLGAYVNQRKAAFEAAAAQPEMAGAQ